MGGDRPGCDFMITKLGERRADTGTSTGRFDVGVLLDDVDRDLIRTRTAEGRSRAKSQGKHWAALLPLHRPHRKRPPDGAHRVLHCRNWHADITSVKVRFRGWQRGFRNFEQE
jgi:hypothetical protein